MLSLTIIGVGRMGRGPETDLLNTYADRIAKLPQKWALNIIEIDDRQAPSDASRKAWDAAKIIPHIAGSAFVVALDERGKTIKSEDFAQSLVQQEREGQPICFAIGGPDGLDKTMRARANLVLSFGAMTWPHKLVRAMIAEQIYRAGAIASGHPYHRA